MSGNHSAARTTREDWERHDKGRTLREEAWKAAEAGEVERAGTLATQAVALGEEHLPTFRTEPLTRIWNHRRITDRRWVVTILEDTNEVVRVERRSL